MFYIGIAGYKRSGKDTVCNLLIEELNKLNITAERRALADPLKEEVLKFLLEYFAPSYSVEELMEWINSSDKEQIRPLWQFWGMGRRLLLGEDYWLIKLKEYIAEHVKSAVLIVPDVRFKNEVNFIKEHKGLNIYVNRPGFIGENHPSEKDLDDFDEWDYYIYNDRTILALKDQVFELANLIHSRLTIEIRR